MRTRRLDPAPGWRQWRAIHTIAAMRVSAGILLYRRSPDGPQVLLAHPGGPIYRKRNNGHWTIPKGEPDPDEPLLEAARREFGEEIGVPVPDGSLHDLGSITQKGGKVVHAWALEGDADPEAARSETFDMEWPPKSGKTETFPEIDRVAWFDLDEARRRIKDTQVPLIDRLEAQLGES